ncbi:MAG: hypothetical protein H6R18_2105, partial [Proteobacteria bacterium]|nr:hypothetical protein [Pseudomonadota bacterium]
DSERTLVDPGYRASMVSPSDETTIPDPGYARSKSGDWAPLKAPEIDDDKTEIDPGFRKQQAQQLADKAKSSEIPQPDTADAPNQPAKPDSHTVSAWAGSSLALPRGHKLFEYRIDNVLGQGGFGITYLATDVHLNSKVAVKEYLPEYFACRSSDKTVSPRRHEDRDAYQQGLDSFLVEARTLATFRHPNIVRVARFFESNETAYMVLEYERGLSLKEWWKQQVQLPEQDFLSLLNPLLEGLMVVHSTGFLHRDIKPDNIYVRKEDGSLVLLDFGAARQASGGDICEDCVVTPGYAPHEQYVGGDQGPWTDIYALGATLYWMVTGAKPPAAPERMEGEDHMVPAVEAGEGRYSREFLSAIDWALRPVAKDRPQNINDFRKALFGAHAASLGLQEALQKGTVDESGEGMVTSLSAGTVKGYIKRFVRTLIHPASWPITVKMTLAMVITALLPMLITAYYNLNGSTKAVSDSALRNLELLAQSSAGRVSQLLHDSRGLAQYIATDDDFQNFLVKPGAEGKIGLQKKLDGLIKSNPDALLMFVMDTNGTALASTDPRIVGQNYKFRDYFKSAVQGKAMMTGIMVGKTTGLAGIYYANPVFDHNKKVIGVVVMRIKAESFGDILNEVHKTSPGHRLFLVDGNGVIIHHDNRDVIYHSIADLPKPVMEKILANETYGRDKIPSLGMPDLATAVVGAKKSGYAVYYSTVAKANKIVGYAPVRGHDWVVAVNQTVDSFAEPLNQMFYNVLYSVVLVGLFFLLIALLFARTIVQPIKALTDAAHALKSGDYDNAHIAVATNDEIGQLARTFNVMIDVLRQRERERQRQANNTVMAAKKK